VPARHWRPVSHRRAERRASRYAILAALLVAGLLGGVGLAMAQYGSRQHPAVTAATATDSADRDGQRASRDLDRSHPPTPTPSVSPSPAASASPSPTPSAAAPSPSRPAPATTKPAVPAGCSQYSGNQLIACQLLPSYGFATSEMAALVPMWTKESNWSTSARNPSSGAYGIPQALPGDKMGTVAADWRTNPATQIKWGLGYIKDRYGTPSAAWSFWQAHGWY
jgi:hypothetical protein